MTTVQKAGLTTHEASVLGEPTPVNGLSCLAGEAAHVAASRLGLQAKCTTIPDGGNRVSDRATAWLDHVGSLPGVHAGATQMWSAAAGFFEDVPYATALENRACNSGTVSELRDAAAAILLVFLTPSDGTTALQFPHLDVAVTATRGTAVLWSPLVVEGWPTPSVDGTRPSPGVCDPAMATVQSGRAPLPTPRSGSEQGRPAASDLVVLRRVFYSTPVTGVPSRVPERVVCTDATACVQYVVPPSTRESQRLIEAANGWMLRHRARAKQMAHQSPLGQGPTIGDLNKVLDTYVAAMRVAPASLHALFMVAHQLGRTGRLRQSARMWRQVVARLPYSVKARGAYASTLVALGDLAGARAELKVAAVLEPENVDVVMQQAIVAERQGALFSAVRLVEKAEALVASMNMPATMGRIRHEKHRLRLAVGWEPDGTPPAADGR